MTAGDPEFPDPEFAAERAATIAAVGGDEAVQQAGRQFFLESARARYSYNFDWLGLPIIQYPQDIVAIQEVLWKVRPRAVVETGVARGGSLALSASILQLLGGDGIVVGVDIDIRPHNRAAIEAHPLAHRIRLVEGSAVDVGVVEQVRTLVGDRSPVVVILDSMHTHDHVLAELELYSPLVQAGSYLLVFDTIVEFMPDDFFPDRPWGPGDNPWTAVQKFLASNDRFEVDDALEGKLAITVAPSGYLRCVR